MRKFEKPLMTVSFFSEENIVTDSSKYVAALQTAIGADASLEARTKTESFQNLIKLQ